MPTPFKRFETKLTELVASYQKYKQDYRRQGYDEANLRLEYLNPLFESLGWDISNRAGRPPHLKDVRVENPANEGSRQKRADYVFRTNGLDRFVCEAKAFNQNLDRYHFQAQNYAFNLRLWIATLTNFDEFHFFVVPGKPDPKSTVPAQWRLAFHEYPANAQRFWDLLSREAVADGALENFIQNIPKAAPRNKKQLWLIKPERTRAIDYEFLNYLENQRARLAQSIHDSNRGIDWSGGALNEAVQKILERLLFQRVCEDKGIDTHVTLENSLRKWTAEGRRTDHLWPLLVSNFNVLAGSFNGGIFGQVGSPAHFSDRLSVSDTWLENFISELSAEDSPYLFNTIPTEILGSVYERFLGSEVQSDGSVHFKPEIRKKGGVYYTPEHVVRYIVKETVSKIIQDKTPKQIKNIKVLDPACGSGTFLIRAFEAICERHIEYFHHNPPKSNTSDVFFDANNEIQLTTELKKRIAVQNIFGIDIDPQAVEVTQLSLYMKILENEDTASVGYQKRMFPKEALLPDLSSNIHVGNSLVEEDIFSLVSNQDLGNTRPFNWQRAFPEIARRGGFDVLIGNPPYEVLEKQRNAASWPHDVLIEYVRKTDKYYEALGGKLNLYRLFVVRSMQLLKNKGNFGMIVPLSLIGDQSTKNTRKYVLDACRFIKLDTFPQKDNRNRRVFFEAKLSTLVMVFIKDSATKSDTYVRLVDHPGNEFHEVSKDTQMKATEISHIDPKNRPIPRVEQQDWNLLTRLYNKPGISYLSRDENIYITRGEINQTIYRDYIGSIGQYDMRFLKGVEVGIFCIHPKLSQGRRESFDSISYERHYGRKQQAYIRRIATQRITGVDESRRIVATVVEPDAYFADSCNSVVVNENEFFDVYFVCALLNSDLFQWRFKLTSTNNNVATNELEPLPFPIFGKMGDQKKELCKEISDLARNAHSYASKREEALGRRNQSNYQKLIDGTLGAINEKVFLLFDFDENDSEIIKSWL